MNNTMQTKRVKRAADFFAFDDEYTIQDVIHVDSVAHHRRRKIA
jgi:hypothetical protein